MPSNQQFNISLPDEVAKVVKAKVAAGEYASESDVVQEGLRSLFARDQAFEDWLATDVAAACDELRADPNQVLSIDQVRSMIAAEHEKAMSKVRTRTLPAAPSDELDAKLTSGDQASESDAGSGVHTGRELEKTQSVTALKGLFKSTVGPVSIGDMKTASGPTVRQR